MMEPSLHQAFNQARVSGEANLRKRFEQLYNAVEQSPVATAITDAQGHIEFVNQRFLAITGYGRDELLGKPPALIQSGMTPDAVYDQLWTTLHDGLAWEGELLNRRKSGELYWEAQTITPVTNTAGEVVSFVTVKEDITRRREQENELRLMAAAFDTGQAILITDPDMVICRVNQAFIDITGYQSHEVVGKTPRLFQSGRHDAAFYRRLRQALSDTGHWQGEIWNRNACGDIYPLWQSISAVYAADGQVRHFVSVFHDIAERKRMERELEVQAMHDHLTGVYNRRAFDAALARRVAGSARDKQPFTLLMFDIDHFKRVNDTYGHDQGDIVLQRLAQRIKGCLRASDVLARWGGEEFTILLHGTGHEGAWVLAERMLRSVRGQAFGGYWITISIGVAEYLPGETHEALVRRVDQALYDAKHRGRDRAVASGPVSA
ncbi:MAG: diguanylate cyclase [Halomonas subglaciescola]|nr:diguanylate cyclase [Halomonas subglaciescola]